MAGEASGNESVGSSARAVRLLLKADVRRQKITVARMAKISDRLFHLFKSPAETKIARDFLKQKLRETPPWLDNEPAEAFAALARIAPDPERLREWCAESLSQEQIHVLQRILRMASQHQRVYKRTVMLSPRAHLLVKTLAELEDMNMSDVIEQHLDRILGERHGMALRTIIDEVSGQVDHDILPATNDR